MKSLKVGARELEMVGFVLVRHGEGKGEVVEPKNEKETKGKVEDVEDGEVSPQVVKRARRNQKA